MADERYQWLDQEAAERLLRGEPVEPARDPADLDDTARAQAELLARTLGAARTPVAVLGPDGELPGEAAALAAFREASAERAAEAAATRYAVPGAAPELGTVQIARAPSGPRWGRSLRYGLAAALAAVTVGGVAVAAGTGVLPLTGEPKPARSVSAVEPPEGSATTGSAVPGSPTGGTGPAVPSVPLDDEHSATPGATGSPATATAGSGHGSATPSPSRTTAGKGGDEDAERSKTLKACREFQEGRLADSGRQRLQSALRNGETVKRYCTRVLSGTPATGDTSGGSDGDDNGDRGGEKHHPGGSGGSGKPESKPGTKPATGDEQGEEKPDRHPPRR
ncbi:hypothetical protein [Streptomyces sp. NPDC094032]|uniref:hypothetical protein n=1 Tax=Streptomyces sp. NPDC094032 TaxID=3155308 RepID=UPI003316AD67